ncbi:hypothetical protein J2T22_001206 [Pseudarthrobacter defluvii]|uniref:Uncharacterized protein n=1 Tax=Pseudarthrobacter defluvii TaxID=410837 RepID=A0ABT9UIG3_9MICC|nr:hypothetical protein [Pseudarthrobacter defluvii]
MTATIDAPTLEAFELRENHWLRQQGRPRECPCRVDTGRGGQLCN